MNNRAFCGATYVKNKKLIPKVSLYAYAVAKDKSLLGPYSIYLRVVERSHPKTHEQRVSVWLSNYIRHCILDYDEQIWKAETNPKRSVEFFDELWNVAMEEIVRKYPQTKWAHQQGLKLKKDFKITLDTKRSALFPGVKRGKVFGIATKLNNMSNPENFPY